MAQNPLEHIIDKVEKERKAFSQKSSLDTISHKIPTRIINRKDEIEQLVRHLLGYKDRQVVPLVSIYGRSGTGKSTLVKYVCNYIDDLKMAFVNLRKAKTVFGGANLILNALDQPSLKSAQGLNVAMEKIQDSIVDSIGSKKLFVLVLDEFDVLFYDKRSSPSDFVYNLVEMQSELNERGILSMIVTISNNVLTDYDLDDRLRSRIGNSEIFFKPYSNNDILEILKQRADVAFGKKISSDVLKRCSQLSSLENGDARRAVDLLRVAAELATQEKKEITIQHVNSASQKLQKDRVNEVLQTLTYHSKIACIAIATKTYGLDIEWHNTSSLYESYKKHAKEPVTYRRFSEILKDLENTGLLESHTRSKGQKGYSSEFKLVVMPEIVGKAINEKWWNENVVKKKTGFDSLQNASISKNDPMYGLYKMLKDANKDPW